MLFGRLIDTPFSASRFPRDCVVLSTLFSMGTLSVFAWLLG
jgi:hypothetical protein